LQIDQATREEASRIFDQDARVLLDPTGERSRGAMPFDLGPARRVLEAAVGRALESDGAVDDTLDAFIRRKVVEQNFVAEAGDAIVDPHYQVPLESQVKLVQTALRHLMRRPDDVVAQIRRP
jgi:hypothetical protein